MDINLRHSVKLPFFSLYIYSAVIGLCYQTTFAEDTTRTTVPDEDLYLMSFEELGKLKIRPAAITKISERDIPASVTVITAEDIKHTPARNIYDLIEVYVPGAIWMNYEEGPQLGVRGIISNHNYKVLLLVNGRIMNGKAQHGAKSELEQWDLNDIEHIEIVRGPGSVIYGPGAVACVINIITHTSDTKEGLAVSTRFVNQYNSMGVNISHGYKSKNYNLFSYASVTHTDGDNAPHFIGTNDHDAGYIGKDIETASKPLDHLGDYENKPQIKLHMDLDFKNDWRFWSRYTQQGSYWKGNEIQTDFDGELLQQQGTFDRQWTNTLEYHKDLRDDMTITTMMSADSLDIERRMDRYNHPNPDHALNKKFNYSETEIFLRGILNWQASDATEIAFGTEYAWDYFGSGWNESEKEMRLGPDGTIISDASSNAFDTTKDQIFVGDGWHSNTYSFFSEANITLNRSLRMLLSGRVDKNTYSDWLFSPRVVLISEMAKGDTIKFIVQQSQRMNTAGQLYSVNVAGKDPEAETLSSFEAIYETDRHKPVSYSLAAFWNKGEIIGWNQDKQAPNEVGELKLFGLEPELNYRWHKGQVGISYAFVKQLDWHLADDVPSSAISYSDYDQPLRDSNATLKGTGNDLNNWPNQSLKFYTRTSLTDKLSLHIDGRWFSVFQGAKDGLTGLENAVDGEPVEADTDAAIKKVKDKDVYDYDLRLNASLTYQLDDNLSMSFFVQNLLGSNNNKRYSYDTGNDRTSPKRVRFVEEERTFGITVRYRF